MQIIKVAKLVCEKGGYEFCSPGTPFMKQAGHMIIKTARTILTTPEHPEILPNIDSKYINTFSCS
jgi:hypothetical protein